MKKDLIPLRAEAVGVYFTDNQTTIREVAKCKICQYVVLETYEEKMIVIPPTVRCVKKYIEEKENGPVAIDDYFTISRTTVCKDLTYRIEDEVLYKKVENLLKKNKDERYIRGGEATRQKYLL